jgi:hypothetical protein
LDSINSFLTPLGNRNKFYYHNVLNPFFRTECIEGIGATAEPMSFAFLASDPVYTLICSYIGTTQHYYNGIDSCASNIFTTIIEYDSLLSFYLFPNPATTSLTINFGKAGRWDVEVWSVVGERIFAPLNPQKGTSASVDVSELPRGIYFVTVRDEAGKRVVRKVVKM